MNDVIRLAAEEAARNYGNNENIFNAAGFSNAIMRIAGLKGAIDGRLVRILLAGRQDIEILSNSYYKIT
jgi:hypothetical protein